LPRCKQRERERRRRRRRRKVYSAKVDAVNEEDSRRRSKRGERVRSQVVTPKRECAPSKSFASAM